MKFSPEAKTLLYDDLYKQFQQVNTGRHLAQEGGKFVTAIAKLLERLEQQEAYKTQRRPAKLEVHIDNRGSVNRLRDSYVERDFFGRPKPDKRNTYYLHTFNRYNFGIMPDKIGLHILGSFCHEAEHAAQHYGNTYNATQRKLIAISTVLYPRHHGGESAEEAYQTSVDYRNNYKELFAHIAEAKLYIAAYQELLQNNPIQLINEKTIMAFGALLSRMTTDVSLQNALDMNQYHLQMIQQDMVDMRALKDYFPAKNHEAMKADVVEFLQTTAPALYELAIAQLQECVSTLSKMLQEMRTEHEEVRQAALRAEQLKTQQMAINYAKTLHIPVIFQPPENAPYGCQTLYPSTMQDLLVHSTFTQHSRVIVIEEGKPPQLMYDHRPIPRPYSTNPTLRAQWETEHQDELDDDVKIYTRDADEPR